ATTTGARRGMSCWPAVRAGTLRRSISVGTPGPLGSAIRRPRAGVCGEHRGHRDALTLGHRTDPLVLSHVQAHEKAVAAGSAPASLAEQNLADLHAREL